MKNWVLAYTYIAMVFVPVGLNAQSAELYGVILSSRQQTITSANSGRLINLVKHGVTVKKGEVIAKLDAEKESIELRLLKNKGAYLQKELEKSRLVQASEKRRYDKNLSLFNSAALSEKDVEESLLKLNLASLEIQILADKIHENDTAMDLKKKIIREKQITAPFAGVVEYIGNQIDSYVVPGKKIATIHSLDRIVRFFVPPASVTSWQIGDSLLVNTGSAKKLVAKVSYISQSIDETTNSVLLEAEMAPSLIKNRHPLISGSEVAINRQ